MHSSLDLMVVLSVSFFLLVSSSLTGTYIAYPLCLSLILFIVVLQRRGFAVRALLKMGLAGARQSIPVVNVLLLVGVVAGVWMAAGTVPALVYYGTGLISPRFFVLWAFVLTGFVSVLMGTSFGAVGTLGIALMVMARSSEVEVNPVAGAIIAGAFVGDRCSPMSSSAHLVAAITHTSIYQNLRNMLVSSRWPLLLSLIFYTLLSFTHPVLLSANSITAELPKVFNLSPVVLMPAGVVLLLAVLRVDVKLAMVASIGVGVAIAHHVQNYDFPTIINFALFGFRLEEESPILQSILMGGGLLPMAKATLVVLISTAFSGIFSGSKTLSFLDRWLQHIRTQRQLGRATVWVSVLANLFGCTQTIGILLTEQVMRPHYQIYWQIHWQLHEQASLPSGGQHQASEVNAANQQLALALEDSAVVTAPLIPWNIAGLIPATILMVGPGFIPYLMYLLLLPLFMLLRVRSPICCQSTSSLFFNFLFSRFKLL